MTAATNTTRFRFWFWLIRFIGVIVPRRFRARWRREWEAELEYREALLARWDRLDWQNKLELLWRSSGAFADALWLQQLRWEDDMSQDLRYGLRRLRTSPGFTGVAVLALALGIGANTAIFSVVNSVLLRPLPFSEPERLVKVWPGQYKVTTAKVELVELQRASRSFEGLAAYSGWSFTLTGRAEPLRLSGARATADFFTLLGTRAALGRTFAADEDQPGRYRVIVLSHAFWQQYFGAEPNIIGQTVTLDGQSHTIIGVLPPDFNFPALRAERTDLWVPAPLDPNDVNDYTAGYLDLLARLKPDVTPEQAQAEVVSISRAMRTKIPRAPNDYGDHASVRPLKNEVIGDSRQMLFVLLGAVGCVLLIACANVANLQLVRATQRQKELAIRAALGARRLRLVRQLLTESTLLALLGGAAGLLLAWLGMNLLLKLLPADTPRLSEVAIDGRVLAFSLALSALTGVLAGLAPALQTSKLDLQSGLKEGGKSSATGRSGRLRGLLVVAEVALVLMLMIGAGLLIRSFWHLQQVNPGFEGEQVLSAQLAPPGSNYHEAPRRRAFYHEVIARVAALPGVEAAGAIHLLPLGGSNWNPGLRVEEQPLPQGTRLPNVDWRVVTPDYFRALGIPLLRGRFFTAGDNENAPGVALINDALARRYWPQADPVGKRLRSGFEQGQWVTIVGVVGGIKHHGLEQETAIEMYRPYDQAPFPLSMTVMARTQHSSAALATALRSAVWSVDREVPVASVQPLAQVVSESLAPRRATMLLLVSLAAVALILGLVGIYGVLAYTVSQRTHEIGIRMALGAQAGEVLELVIKQGMALALSGVALGLAGAFALTRVMKSLLFTVSATDPLTFAGVAALFAFITLLACYLPARRAAKVDPLIALRHE
jgi:putative ABC transport system permease protein